MKTIKFFVLISLAVMTSLPAVAQAKTGKQKIKSIVVYEEKHDALISRKYKESEVYYDEKGNIIEDISYKQGKVNKHFKYKYDDDGNKIFEQEFDSNDKIIEYTEYEIKDGLRTLKTVYDRQGNIKTVKKYVYTKFE
jgi:hypothetical protein